MARLGLALLALALVLSSSVADAATVSVKQVYDKAAYVGDRVEFRAAPGEANDVTMTQDALATLSVADLVPLTPGAGCAAVSALAVRCTVRSDGTFNLDARLGDGDDTLDASRLDPNFARLVAGPGADRLVGPADSFATTFDEGKGDDQLVGGHGQDLFREGATQNGADDFIGGSQVDPESFFVDDQVDYSDRRRAVGVSLDGRRNDGEKGEHDRIGVDLEEALGGAGADRMIGDAGDNRFVGGAGRDVMRGGAGNDYLLGDELLSHGSKQGDVIYGGRGEDRLEGGVGDDRMNGASGHDSVLTGDGHDRVRSDDRTLDAILCGPGRDRIRHDGTDFVASDCGRQRGPVPAHPLPLLWTDTGDRLTLALGCPFRRSRRCTGDVTLTLRGQSFAPHKFSLLSGAYAYYWILLGGRTADHPDPPLDGGVLTLRWNTSGGRTETRLVPLSAVHRDPSEVPSFLPLSQPLL